MNADTEDAIRHIYEQWHESVVRRDIRALMELDAEDAILESPRFALFSENSAPGSSRARRPSATFSPPVPVPR